MCFLYNSTVVIIPIIFFFFTFSIFIWLIRWTGWNFFLNLSFIFLFFFFPFVFIKGKNGIMFAAIFFVIIITRKYCTCRDMILLFTNGDFFLLVRGWIRKDACFTSASFQFRWSLDQVMHVLVIWYLLVGQSHTQAHQKMACTQEKLGQLGQAWKVLLTFLLVHHLSVSSNFGQSLFSIFW